MDFRDFGEKRVLQRPAIDVDDVALADTALKGSFGVSLARYEGGEYSGVSGEGEISRSLLSRLDLSVSRYAALNVADVVLEHADMSNGEWSQVTARRVELVSCRATGWRLSLALAWDVYVADSRLDYSMVEIHKAKGLVVFERCSFSRAQLVGDLSRVLLVNCNLGGVEFCATAARGCDLRSSQVGGASGLMSMRGARITDEQVAAVAEQLAREVGFQIG